MPTLKYTAPSFPELSDKAHPKHNPEMLGTWPRPTDVSIVLYFYYKALKWPQGCHFSDSQWDISVTAVEQL